MFPGLSRLSEGSLEDTTKEQTVVQGTRNSEAVGPGT